MDQRHDLKLVLRSGTPVVVIETEDERRILEMLQTLVVSESGKGEYLPLFRWTVTDGLQRLEPVTHVGTGRGRVEQVASNRRILDANGKVQFVRYTACADPKIRAFPEGTIDPFVRVVSFWSGERSIAVLSYYATHPQSYYQTGKISADFVGMARDMRESAENTNLHIHFNGAGGNIGAGKYNDGSPENRPILAGQVVRDAAKPDQAFQGGSLRPTQSPSDHLPRSHPFRSATGLGFALAHRCRHRSRCSPETYRWHLTRR